MRFRLAHTAPINPPPAPLKLTRAQVWAGLEHKSRDPLRFVPAIVKCEVLKEHETGLTRLVEFKPGTGPPGKITETVEFIKEVRADFHMVDIDTRISNIISSGGEESDLYLTFTYDWNFPELVEGSAEALERQTQFQHMAQQAVATTIDQLRELAGGKA